jgi:DNA-binding NarL/FixJ family response regulator
VKTTVESAPITVALVEDDPRIRDTLARVIAKSPRFRFLQSFADASQALAELPSLAPGVVVMDLELPSMNGIECTRLLREKSPATQILILTVFGDSDQVFRALAAGASGYLLKRTPREEILQAIEQVWEGGAPMSAEIARTVVESFRSPAPARPAARAQLTPREEEVLRLLARGCIVKEIAEALGIGFDTVKFHLKNVYEKLHARSRTEALIKSGFYRLAENSDGGAAHPPR